MSDHPAQRHVGAPAPGDIVAGKYRVERVIGAGGMGIVVAALHVDLDEPVAIKVLRPEVASPETTARFLREARAAAKIKSEHVVRVSDVGTSEGGTPYMVMELLEGNDLLEVLRERGPLPPADAVEYLLEACEAVAEAHALGIVHRDLKPANLFLARRPGGKTCVKVVDFGISKVVSKAGAFSEDAAMTRTASWLGSPLYMSPEQMRSARSVDARTDIWSLGLILYQLLTGRVPFDATSLPDLCAKVIHEPPAPLDELRADLPAGLSAVVLRCLEKSPDARYLNVAELALALEPFAPERAKESVERIVGVIEAAGLMRPSKLPKAPVLELVETEDRTSEPPSSGTRTIPPARGSAPDAEPASAATATPEQDEGVKRVSTPAPPRLELVDEPRRGGALLVLLGFALAAAMGAGAFFAWRSVRPPLETRLAPTAPSLLPPPTAAPTTSAPVITPATPADAGVADAGVADAGVADAGVADAGVADAGVADAGADAGARRARWRPPWARTPPVERPRDPTPTPQAPSPSAQTCFQTLPDGTVKQVPCP